MSSDVPSIRIYINLLLVSAASIAYQIVLMKLYAIAYWHHFAYLVISIAMLGIGASGTFIAIFQRKFNPRTSSILFVIPVMTVIAIWMNIYLGKAVDFNPIMILWDRKEAVMLLLLSFSLFVPFFLCAILVGTVFSRYSKDIHKLYFLNLTGSGLGSLIILLGLFRVDPHGMLVIISSALVSASLSVARKRRELVLASCCLILLIPFYVFVIRSLPLEMNSFKDQKHVEAMKGSKKELELFGPLGLLVVIDSPAFHFMPDLSLRSDRNLPYQKAMFLDGNMLGPITAYSRNIRELDFMDWRSGSLAYKLLENPGVLVLGSGSGTEILNALYHEAESISVVEVNPDIVKTIKGPYGIFSGDLYAAQNLQVHVQEGRGYLENTSLRYDLIILNFLESMGASTGGMYSINENYLLTKEAMISCLKRLKPHGYLSMSRWIRNPPRDIIKLTATVIEAMEILDKQNPGMSLVLIRSWQAATILVKNGRLEQSEIETIKKFCRERLFDVVYYPGVREPETKIYNELENDSFHTATVKLLSPGREAFYNDFPFYVRPATDNMPFFSHFFKTDVLKKYLDSFDRTVIPFLDWGYILVWISLGIMIFLGIVFIVAPIPLVGRNYGNITSVLVYFGCLGLAYMLMEISVLQQFVLYLYDPVYSVSLVVGSFLFYSGIGSMCASSRTEIRNRDIIILLAALVVMGALILSSGSWLQKALAGMTITMRMLICSILIAPLAFVMGMPFPSGLLRLSSTRSEMIPWAWGINGFFSVTGGSLAVILAINWGFKAVMITGLFMYAIAALFLKSLGSKIPWQGYLSTKRK